MSETNSNISLNINEKSIAKAVSIIENDKIDNVELKSILLDLVQDIVTLKDATKSKIRSTQTTQLDNSKYNEQYYHTNGGRVSVIEQVQSIISTKYTEIIKATTSEVEYRNVLREIVTSTNIKMPGCNTIGETIDELYKELKGFSVLDDFINQPEDMEFEDFIEEIRVDDFNDIRIVRAGIEERANVQFESPKHLEMFANTLVNNSNQQFSIKHSAVRLRIGKTARVTMIRNPIAVRDKRLTMDDSVIHIAIRKQRSKPFTIQKLIELNSITKFASELLRCLVGSGVCTTFIGGTGTGKTSMMVPFLKEITQRTISMAEIDEMNYRELDFDKYIKDENGNEVLNPNYLKAKNSAIMWEIPNLNTEILPGIYGFEGLFNIGLTMTPKVFIIQETKGSEALSLENAAISGHQTVTSIHCERASLFPTRVMKMIQMSGSTVSEDIMMKEIVESFPLIVTCMRLKDGTRKISEIVEMLDYIPETKEVRTNTLMRYEIAYNTIDPKTHKLKTYGSHKIYNLPTEKLQQKMLQNGLLQSDWDRIKTDFNKYVTPEKPADLDRTIYKG